MARKVATVCLFALFCCAGSGCSTLGWGFNIGQTGEVYQPVPYHLTAPQTITQPLIGGPATMPAANVAAPQVFYAPQKTVFAEDYRGPIYTTAQPGCSLDDACKRLDALERRRASESELLHRPMPRVAD